MEEWITVKEAGELLEISERQVINRIHRGKLKAKKEGRLWRVHRSLSEDPPVTEETPTEAEEAPSVTEEVPPVTGEISEEAGESELVKALKERIAKQDEQLERMEERLSSESDRRDALILQITRITEQNQLLLEDKSTPWYRKLRRKRKTDAPGG